MQKDETFKNKPILLDHKTLEFITKNILYTETSHSNEKDCILENLMAYHGGTRAEIDHLSRVRLKIKK